MQLVYDPLDKNYKNVIGGVREKQRLTIKVKSDAKKAEIVLFRDGHDRKAYPMERSSGGFFAFSKTFRRGLYWYYFIADGVEFGKNYRLKAEKGCKEHFQLTVYAADYEAPTLFKGGLIYQIFPDRFYNEGGFEVGFNKVKREDWGGLPVFRSPDGKVYNNEFFGGNFKGITAKLDYLKSLNVTCIYLNPICKAYSSHRYDTGNYIEPDEVLGTVEDLKKLLDEGSKRGISFIFDGVYNHTGADSVYFNRYGNYPDLGAYQSPASDYFDWYNFNRFPNEYDSWWGFETLPSIRKNCTSFWEFITKTVIPFYMELGFKGVRLDVVDELKSDFVKEIAKAVKKYDKNGVVIGEVWEDATNKIAYGVRTEYFFGEELDSVMNYPLKDGIIGYLLTGDVTKLTSVFNEQKNNYPKCALDNLMNVLSTHDTSRLLTVLGRERVETNKDLMQFEKLEGEALEKGKRLFKMAYAAAFTAYGVPSLYYGDEAGVWGDLDPYNRKCFPWGHEDKELLSFIKKLSDIRSKNDVFFDGEMNILYAERKVLIYERSKNGKKIVVGLSRFESDVKVVMDEPYEDLLSKGGKKMEFVLPSDGVIILKN